mmetsp:Transcript_38369/g.73524  ORF Transcript_38369/g.73524 Transcript_38369/m.73524 type:complete len:242 (-) Transcript_38369:246-971(-)
MHFAACTTTSAPTHLHRTSSLQLLLLLRTPSKLAHVAHLASSSACIARSRRPRSSPSMVWKPKATNKQNPTEGRYRTRSASMNPTTRKRLLEGRNGRTSNATRKASTRGCMLYSAIAGAASARESERELGDCADLVGVDGVVELLESRFEGWTDFANNSDRAATRTPGRASAVSINSSAREAKLRGSPIDCTNGMVPPHSMHSSAGQSRTLALSTYRKQYVSPRTRTLGWKAAGFSSGENT